MDLREIEDELDLSDDRAPTWTEAAALVVFASAAVIGAGLGLLELVVRW